MSTWEYQGRRGSSISVDIVKARPRRLCHTTRCSVLLFPVSPPSPGVVPYLAVAPWRPWMDRAASWGEPVNHQRHVAAHALEKQLRSSFPHSYCLDATSWLCLAFPLSFQSRYSRREFPLPDRPSS
jgi:hypothetical protein